MVEPAECWYNAVFSEDMGLLKHLEKIKAKDINKKYPDEDNWTPLILASYEGLATIAKVLIKNGANVDVADDIGNTPLMWCAQAGSLDIAKALLKAGANVDKQDKNGSTALFAAVNMNCIDITKLLIANGADIHHKDKKGMGIFDYRSPNKISDYLKGIAKIGKYASLLGDD